MRICVKISNQDYARDLNDRLAHALAETFHFVVDSLMAEIVVTDHNVVAFQALRAGKRVWILDQNKIAARVSDNPKSLSFGLSEIDKVISEITELRYQNMDSGAESTL